MKVDTSALVSALSAIRSELPGVVASSLDTLAEIGVTNAKSSRLFKDQTGALRRRIQFLRDGDTARTVIADTNYAGYVEFGNGPPGSKIYPKKAKALRFNLDGQIVFRKWVRAHGPLPFMGNARNLMVSFIPDLFSSNIERMINKHRGT